jgi:hypothetical protein
MVELGQECFVLMLNLREDDPIGTFCKCHLKPVDREANPFAAFPQSDRNVRQYLQGMELTTDIDDNWRLRYAAFLCGIFTVISTILDASVSKPSEFAKKLEKYRSEIISKVIESSKVSSIMLPKMLLTVCDRSLRKSSKNCTVIRSSSMRP